MYKYRKINKLITGGEVAGIMDVDMLSKVNKNLMPSMPQSSFMKKSSTTIQQDMPKFKSSASSLNLTKPTSGFGNFMGSTGMNIASQALGAIGNIGGPNGGEQAAAIKSGIRSVTDKLGPIGMAIGAADDLLGGIAGMAGKKLDGVSTGDKVISSIPVIGNAASLFSSKLTKHNFDRSSVASDYSFNKEQAASDLGGKSILFGKGKKEKQIANAWSMYNKKADITDFNKKRLDSDAAMSLNTQNQLRFSGGQQLYSLAKHGMKFPELDEARVIISRWSTNSTEPKKFQLGGKMNLIPEGALHARKHNLEKINPELEGQITSKGIPVVAQGEGGVIQQAEIEKEEVIFRKEFTDELERLYKQYQDDSSDDIAIEAGKLICYELLKNTDDRSGLIKSIE
mgnify:FL=1|jgi:hypothetical protein|uniref:Uncharacterized protein n=1 Tax=Siphoviridae sp. gcode 4 TaxID=2838368 RepID=A0A8S5RTA8_9CAUD|nr:MAG TPA_asm: hypothetical protein [Siphoviridae sp. gcode 4]